MITLAWAVCCNRIIIDRDTNAVSYIDVVHGYAAKELPLTCPLLMLGCVWATDELGVEMRQRVEIAAPSGAVVHEYESDPFQLALPIHRYHYQFGGFEMKESGVYLIRVQLLEDGQERTVAELPLGLKVAKPEEPASEEAPDDE